MMIKVDQEFLRMVRLDASFTTEVVRYLARFEALLKPRCSLQQLRIPIFRCDVNRIICQLESFVVFSEEANLIG